MMQKNEPIKKMADYLKGIHSAFTNHFKPSIDDEKGGQCPSLYARIGDALIRHSKTL